MPTGDWNRKYVYLTPRRAARVLVCVADVLKTQQAKREALTGSGTVSTDYEFAVLCEDIRLLVDCVARLEKQVTREDKFGKQKVRGYNNGEAEYIPEAQPLPEGWENDIVLENPEFLNGK